MEYYKLDEWKQFKTEKGEGCIEPGLGLSGVFNYKDECRWVVFTLEEPFKVRLVEEWGDHIL